MAFLEINETDIVRLVLKYLKEKQYYKAFTNLEIESNINLDNYPQELQYLRQLIIEGYFDDIQKFLSIFQEKTPQSYKEIMYEIKKQQFMELILEETEADLLIQILKEIEELTNKENYKKLFQFLRLKNVHTHPFYQNWSIEKGRLICFDTIRPILESLCFQQNNTQQVFENTLQQAFERLVYLESKNYGNIIKGNQIVNLLKSKQDNGFLKYDVQQKYNVGIADLNKIQNQKHSRQNQSLQYNVDNKSQIYDSQNQSKQQQFNVNNNYSIAFHNLQSNKQKQQQQQSYVFTEQNKNDSQYFNIKSTKNEQPFEQPLNYDIKHLSGNKSQYQQQEEQNDQQQNLMQQSQIQMQQMQQSLMKNMSQLQNQSQHKKQNINQNQSQINKNDSQEEEVVPLSAKSSKKKLSFHNRWFSFDNGFKNKHLNQNQNQQQQQIGQNQSVNLYQNNQNNNTGTRLNKSGINTYQEYYQQKVQDEYNEQQYQQQEQQFLTQSGLEVQSLHNKVNRRIKNKSAVYNTEYQKLDLNNISEKSSTSSQEKSNYQDNQISTMRKCTDDNTKPTLNDVSVSQLNNNNNQEQQFQSFNPSQGSQLRNNSSQYSNNPQSKIMNFIHTNTQELENSTNSNNFESLQPNISTPNQLQQHKYIEQEQNSNFFDHNFSDIVEIAKIKDTHPIRTSAFSSDGENFVLGTNSKSLKIYSLSQLVQPEYIEQYLSSNNISQESEVELLFEKKNHHPGSIYTVDWSRSGKLIATGSNDKSIKILSIEDGQVENIQQKLEQGSQLTECQLNGHNGIVRTLQINESENYLYSAGTIDNNIKIWDIETQKIKQTLDGHSDSIYSIQLGGEGKYLASVGLDRKIILWDISYNKPMMQLDASMFTEMNSISLSESMNNYFLNSIIKNSSGGNKNLQQQKNKIVAAHKDGTVTYWDIQMQKFINKIQIHDNDCRSVEFDPTTNYIATASFDHTVGIYDINKNKLEIQISSHTDRVVQARFHPYYPFILSTSADCTSRIFAPRSFLQKIQYQSNNSKLSQEQNIDYTTSQFY